MATVIFESTPMYPDASRMWQVVDDLKATILYTSPTALRSLIREGDDCADDRQITCAAAQVVHEALVDLEGVHRQRLQMREHAVSGAEIVDGDLDAHFLEGRQGDPGGLDVLYDNAFGDLQADRLTGEPELAEDVGHRIRESVGDQLDGRDVEP